ncbi:DNA polymerase LigD, ligase domain [Streptantibioticus cattleyicolor NRRL 8057 = DSM 46488]|nr:DNA polymerase LigD, ligase domain [Streptantibioticus cattleyicolor NRRL 8057 = DSM 46488]
MPDRVTPMLAVLSDRRHFDDTWVLERKLDGVRAIGFRDGDTVRLASRTGQRLENTYPEIVRALADQPQRAFVVDGEIVALDDGRTSFERLQRRMQLTRPSAALASGVAVTYFLFDLLHLAGHDTTGLPLRSRKELLREAVRYTGPLRYTEHHTATGDAGQLLDAACAQGWEGLIAKRADGRYQQRRSSDWLKLKCLTAQEFVVGGYTEPAGSRAGFGALLLGYHQGGRLRYAGKVGTGYDTATLRRLRGLLDERGLTEPPFAEPVRERGAHWVRPDLVVQVAFTEWTRDGRLRAPRYLGLRQDKRPERVVREG